MLILATLNLYPMKNTLVLVMVGVLFISTNAQLNVDSLVNAVKSAQGEQKVKTFNELFKAYLNIDPIKAVSYAREALSLAIEISDDRGMAASYNNLGITYRNQGALDKALENYLVALELYTKLDNKEGIASTKNNVGNIYVIKKDKEQAQRYLDDSNKLLIEMKDSVRLVGSLTNLGNLFNEFQDYESAMKYYKSAWEIGEKVGVSNSDQLINMGNLYLKQNNYDRAIEYFSVAASEAKEEGNQFGLLSISTSLGEAFAKSGKAKLAETELLNALELSQSLQAYVYEPNLYKSLAASYAQQKKMDKAYDAMLRYEQARERIYSEESSRKIAQMEMAMSIQATEKELEAVKKDDAMKTMELRQTQMIVALIFLAILVSIMLISLFTQRRKIKTQK